MAVTEVDQDFTYNYDSILQVSMGSQLATLPLFNSGDANTLEIQIDGALQSGISGALSKNVVEVSMAGSLIVQGSGSGSASVLEIQATGSMYASNKIISGEASVVELSIEGSGFVSNSLSMDKEVVILSMEGLLIQNNGVIIPADDDTEYPFISGEEYIVVNLRTKAHATYKDGERTAVAKTASMNFGTYTDKSVSDLYLLSRAKGTSEVVVTSGENVERRYPLSFGDTTPPNLKNKKRPLAKGLKATNWSVSIVVADESHLEVRGLEMLVTDIKRRT